MAQLERRLTFIEKAFARHLEESGTIRTDLRWLKHAFWSLLGAAVTFGAAFLAKH